MAVGKDEVNQFVIRLDDEDASKMVDAMLAYIHSLCDELRTTTGIIQDFANECFEPPDKSEIKTLEEIISKMKMASELTNSLTSWINGELDEKARGEKDVGLHFNNIP